MNPDLSDEAIARWLAGAGSQASWDLLRFALLSGGVKTPDVRKTWEALNAGQRKALASATFELLRLFILHAYNSLPYKGHE